MKYPQNCRKTFVFLLLYMSIIGSLVSCSNSEKETAPEDFTQIGAFEFPGGEGRILTTAQELSTAELLTIAVEMYTKDGTIALIPDIPEKMGDLTVVEQKSISAPVSREKTETEDDTPGDIKEDLVFATGKTFTIAPFLPGEAEVDPLEIQYKTGDDGDWESLFTQKIPFTVTSVISGNIEEAPFLDSAEPQVLEGLRLWQLILIISLTAAAAGVCLYIFVIRKPKEEIKEIIPPHVTAIRELETLKKDALAEKGEYNLYYTKLTEVIRHYIDGRFDLTTSEQTTEEFIRNTLGLSIFNIQQKAFLRDFLIRSDIIKFADGTSTVERSEYDYNQCRNMVEETKAIPEEKEDGSDEGGEA